MVTGRLAPTPSGGLHLGNARTFLIAWLSARAAGGRVVLRVDDLDRQRCQPAYVEEALADLAWLGLDWDGPPLYQSRRDAAYAAALDRLRHAGCVYASYASRRELARVAHAPHAGEAAPAPSAALAPHDRAPAWRFRAGNSVVSFEDALHGRVTVRVTDDFVVLRNDGLAAYQLATVVDDHFQGVTEVVRGDDLLESAARQILLARALGLPSPRYVHVPLVLDADGQRLAKRRDSTRLSALRAAGIPAERVVGLLAASCGWAAPGECVAASQLIGRLDWSRLPRRPVRLSDGGLT